MKIYHTNINNKMPCSICGGLGHNRRTCPKIIEQQEQQEQQEQGQEQQEQQGQQEQEQHVVEDPVITLIMSEKYIRDLLISGKIHDLDEEKIKFFESLLSFKKKEFRLINLDHKRSYDIYISNENSNVFTTENEDYSYVATIGPRSFTPITAFTGYNYLFTFYNKDRIQNEQISKNPAIFNLCDSKLTIDLDIKDTYILNENYYQNDKSKHRCSTFKLNLKNQSLISSLKMNYLLNQMKRLGGLEDEKYGSILDMHEDIEIPEHDDLDLEAAGLPNKLFTNVT